jgi:hypothetical protein
MIFMITIHSATILPQILTMRNKTFHSASMELSTKDLQQNISDMIDTIKNISILSAACTSEISQLEEVSIKP